MCKPRVAILGAGPAGLGAAFQLARQQSAEVTVLEQNSYVGGNAGSFELNGIHLDYGSHRLHPACDPEVLRDIRSLLKADLLDRPRHGRIRLRRRWIHFPLKPLDLALKLPPAFAIGTFGDILRKQFPGGNDNSGCGKETFASVLQAGLGRTICRDFYFPYARKLWGTEPESLSAIQAHRRVSAGSLAKIVRKVLAAIPGLKPEGSGRFFYPVKGFGQISEAYYQAAVQAGVQFHFNTSLTSVNMQGASRSVSFLQDGQEKTIETDNVWSTIPITVLARLLMPSVPMKVLEAAENLAYRSMILVYLILEQNQFTEYDAHYFPETAIGISRLSEPKNYNASIQPEGKTILCAELPCSKDDDVWTQSDEELGTLVCESLAAAGIPIQTTVLEVVTRRLPQAYPIYTNGYDEYFDQLDKWLGGVDGLLTFGRQGVFAHDNTHHALFMGYSAARCLDEEGQFDSSQWQRYREIFKTHVVED
ncbi:protoporphyrinogen/coproporphyrinogen oxidase [Desulfogranum japonicum]|uniref:protoporphyrinogen/coproporphyrinogen oxidase n=1 Tax=Desulfogranum japonicum TaxID=231447 RepID=UPI0003FEA90F|nr:FAD-dependent oxidoreductase [Desulfogranum japonicum]